MLIKRMKRKRAQPGLSSDRQLPRNGKTAGVLKAIAVLTWHGSSGPSGQEDSSSWGHFLTKDGAPMWGLCTGGTFPLWGWGSCQRKMGNFIVSQL